MMVLTEPWGRKVCEYELKRSNIKLNDKLLALLVNMQLARALREVVV
jgi:hypothetical protein